MKNGVFSTCRAIELVRIVSISVSHWYRFILFDNNFQIPKTFIIFILGKFKSKYDYVGKVASEYLNRLFVYSFTHRERLNSKLAQLRSLQF